MVGHLNRKSDVKFISEYMEESQRLENMAHLSLLNMGLVLIDSRSYLKALTAWF